MGRWVALLKPFRRKTIESNFKRVLPQPYRVRIAIDAPAGPSDSKIGEKMKQDDAPSGNGVSAEGLANDAAAPAEAGDNAVMQIALMEDSIDFGGRHINPPDLLPLAQQGAPFIPSSSFKGGLSGYVFKTGDDGQLGYYKDSEMERPLITQVKIHWKGKNVVEK